MANQGANQGDNHNNNESHDSCCLWIAGVMGGCIMVYVLVCLITFCIEHFTENTNRSFQYSHQINVQLIPQTDFLENKYILHPDSFCHHVNWNNQYYSPFVSVKIDSVQVAYEIKLDSLLKSLEAIDRKYKEYYSDALSDLRQESNNIINKWNAWFGFWTSLLALLMGIVPLVIQFRIADGNKKRFEKEREHLRVEFEKERLKIQTEKSEIESFRQDTKKDVDEQLNRMKSGMIRTEIVNEINAIDIGKNNKLLKDSKDRILLLGFILKDLRIKLNDFISANKALDKGIENKYPDLLVVLIDMQNVVIKLLPYFQSKNNSRKYQELQDKLQKLILMIAHDRSNPELIYNEAEKLHAVFFQLVDEFK